MLLNKNNFVRISGILAIFGMTMILMADIKLCYMPLSSKEYSIFRAALTRSKEEIIFYSKFALAGTLLVIAGMYHFYLTLRRTNKILAWVTVGIYIFSYANAAIYYAYLAYIMNVAKIIMPIQVKIPFFMRHMYFTFQIQYFYFIIGGSILFFISLGFFKNNYPKWYIWFNPLYLLLVFRLGVPMFATPEYAGFFITASPNLAMLITLFFSTILLWKKSIDDLIPDLQTNETSYAREV